MTRHVFVFVHSLVLTLLALTPARSLDGPRELRLIVCDSASDSVYAFEDRNSSGFIEADVPGEITTFYDDSSSGPDLSTPSHLAAGPDGDLYMLDSGTLNALLRLSDRNGDGDALDEGEISVFYDGSAGGPKLSTPNTVIPLPTGGFLISDDGSGAKRILRVEDKDHDGDALDLDEVKVIYDATALSLPVLGDIESMAVSGDGSIFVGDTTLQAIFVLKDRTGDGDCLDEGEVLELFHSSETQSIGDADALVLQDGKVYVCDSDTGRILSFQDHNGDGDALDEGEALVFLGEGSELKVGGITDILAVAGGGFIALDNSKDSVVLIQDLNADGDALDAGETVRWTLDNGATLGTPSGIALTARRAGPPPVTFLRGDATEDQKLDISDPVAILGYLFLGKSAPSCADTLDANDTGDLNISDAIFLLNYLFTGGEPPPPPAGSPGTDPTPDELPC